MLEQRRPPSGLPDLEIDLPGDPPLPTARHALFLDFDGTLVALADHPDHIVVPDLLQETLAAVDRQLGGALAIVTGRSLESLDRFLAPLTLRAAGIHGAQLRRDPQQSMTETPPLGDLAARLTMHFADDPAIWIEDKRAAVAVHYRQAPSRRDEVFSAMSDTVCADELEIVSGKCVFEARRRGSGKDSAVRALMSVAPFRGRIPVFVGDDHTDEDGIREVQRHGGCGIKVGIGASDAHWRLPTPVAVLAWLHSMLSA